MNDCTFSVAPLWNIEPQWHKEYRATGGLFQGFLNFCGRNFHMTLGTRVYKYTNHICWLSHKEIYFGATIWYTLILLKIRTNFHTNTKNVLHFYSEWSLSGHVWDCRMKNITMFSPQTKVPNSIIITAESAASQKGTVQRTVPFQKFLKFCPNPKPKSA